MPNPPRRVYASTLRKVNNFLLSQSISTSDLLKDTELKEAELVDPYHLISETQARMYYRNVIKLADSDGLGLEIGSMSSLAEMGPVGITQLAARTVRDALEGGHANRYIYYLLVDWKVDISGGHVVHRLSSRETDERLRIFMLERALATLQAHGEELAGPDLTPLRVQLDYKAPVYFQRYKEIFRCPVSFGQDAVEISYASDYLEAEIPTYDPQLGDVVGTLRDSMREKLSSKGGILNEVRLALRRTQGQFPGLEGVAESLAMSSRTLRRKLGEYDVTFQQLLDEERRRVAEDYLLTTPMNIQQIAEQCGFSDAQNFSQAFRRWSGVSPTEYRNTRQK
ncbi:MAG: AraC family transcriptional regulator ligand-binding domain-containing protein [Halioglobus sp.]